MGVCIIHHDGGDNFGVKAQMLGLSMDRQVEELNKLYKGELTFGVSDSPFLFEVRDGIVVTSVNKPCAQIVLPDTKFLYAEEALGKVSYDLLTKGVQSVVLPKSVEKLDLRHTYWVNHIQRLFVYDTTELDFKDFENGRNDKLEMIVVKPFKKLSKPLIYRVS